MVLRKESQSLLFQVKVPTDYTPLNCGARNVGRNPFFFRSRFQRMKFEDLLKRYGEVSQSLLFQVKVPTEG